MKVVFRTDASVRIGTGHVVRCRTLAEALRARGAKLLFVCRDHPGNMIDALASKAIPVTRLSAPPLSANAGEDYAQWRGVTQVEDAAQTLAALDGERPDWLVVDHYGLDAEWERALRPDVGHLMVIDDLANRRHDCDLLLDQNFTARGNDRYRDLVSVSCKLLTGPLYALLRPEYGTYRKFLRPRDGCVSRVLVFMGGSDPDNLTGMVLKALSDPELEGLQVDAVIGPSNPHLDELEWLGKARPNTSIYGPRPHLADLMASADLAIGAGGATTWERMCMGLPAIVISIAANQVPTCLALERAGLIYYAGESETVTVESLKIELLSLRRNSYLLKALSAAGQRIVDGRGADRVTSHIFNTGRN